MTQQERLRIPPDSETLLLDMTEHEFAKEARALPVQWRIALRLLRPILWGATLSEGGRHGAWETFSKRSHVRGLHRSEGPVRELIKAKRDTAMAARLRDFAQDSRRIERAVPAVVVSGAARMPALYRTLRDCGYEKGSVRWFEVLDGLRMPSRSAGPGARPERD